MGEYTPTTENVRNCYVYSAEGYDGSVDERKYGAEFDRWLKVERARIWREGALWSAVECGAVPSENLAWLVTSDNPYEGDPR